jgi:hypothetical protein
MTLYFIESIKPQKRKVFIALAVIGWPLLASLNVIYLQPFSHFNSNILMVESFVFIAMALYTYYELLLNNSIRNIAKEPLFWQWTLFLLYWSSTYFFWGYIGVFQRRNQNYVNLLQCIQAVVNIILYAGLGCSFLFFSKKTVNES